MGPLRNATFWPKAGEGNRSPASAYARRTFSIFEHSQTAAVTVQKLSQPVLPTNPMKANFVSGR